MEEPIGFLVRWLLTRGDRSERFHCMLFASLIVIPFCFQFLESLWLIIKGNVSLIFNLVTTVLSMVFFSGTYLLNTGLSLVSVGTLKKV